MRRKRLVIALIITLLIVIAGMWEFNMGLAELDMYRYKLYLQSTTLPEYYAAHGTWPTTAAQIRSFIAETDPSNPELRTHDEYKTEIRDVRMADGTFTARIRFHYIYWHEHSIEARAKDE